MFTGGFRTQDLEFQDRINLLYYYCVHV